MTNSTYHLEFNVTGAERKQLVKAIGVYMDANPKYQGAPSFSYQIGSLTIDRNGLVAFSDESIHSKIGGLLESLADHGFVAANTDLGDIEAEEKPATQPSGYGLTITLPTTGFTPEALHNLRSLLEAKGNLICKALGVSDLPIKVDDNFISFPWFEGKHLDSDEVKAYTHLIAALCDMAWHQKRITAKKKETENDKYAFRCFLLRLGFIGAEFKAERKVLLRSLTGSSAFKGGAKKEAIA